LAIKIEISEEKKAKLSILMALKVNMESIKITSKMIL